MADSCALRAASFLLLVTSGGTTGTIAKASFFRIFGPTCDAGDFEVWVALFLSVGVLEVDTTSIKVGAKIIFWKRESSVKFTGTHAQNVNIASVTSKGDIEIIFGEIQLQLPSTLCDTSDPRRSDELFEGKLVQAHFGACWLKGDLGAKQRTSTESKRHNPSSCGNWALYKTAKTKFAAPYKVRVRTRFNQRFNDSSPKFK